MYVNAALFSQGIRKYFRAGGHFQQDLATKIGLSPKVLSHKLKGNGVAHLTDKDVKSIIQALADWKAITTRAEALHLLELAQLQAGIFSEDEWKEPPLCQLEEGEQQQHNLSAPPTRFVGRGEQVEQLRALIAQDEARLVTLVGPGGSGKTRLAQHVAKEVVRSFAQGVWFVSLAPVSDASLVLQSIMQTLSVQSSPDASPVQSLIVYLRHKKLLLILDNFEQVTDAADLVGELLAAASGLKVLVTSRAVLRLSGEHELEVPPLDMPEPGMALTKERAERFGAIQLFVERARLVNAGFTLTDENAALIAQICARVDGLPLALELAAARIRSLTPQQLLEKLSGARLAILKGGARDLPDRHHTLLNTIQWSYALLLPIMQAGFARLGVFNGGWSLDAVEAMMRAIALPHDEEEDCSPSEMALDLLDHLLSNSLLVKLARKDGPTRFTMLETLREYALRRLKRYGETECLRDWHACYYLGMAEEGEWGLRGAQQMVWLERLRADHDNFRAALEWSLERAADGASMKMNETGNEICAVEVALRLASALGPFWEWQGYLFEGRNWLEAALKVPYQVEGSRTDIMARAKALSALSRLYCLQNEQSKCVAVAEESIALWRQLDDAAGLAMALFHRAWPEITQSNYELATSLFEQGLQLLSGDDVWLRAQILFLLGDMAGFTGKFDLMRAYHRESKAIFEQLGDRSAVADVLKDGGGFMILEQKYTEAIHNIAKSIEMSQELGYKQFIGTGMGLLGFAVGMRGEPDEKTAIIQALHLWGASNGLLGAIGSSPWLSSVPGVPEMVMIMRMRVDDATWRDENRRGRSLTVEQAMTAFRESYPSL